MPEDEDTLTVKQVNEVMMASGLDPEAVRTFARDLVSQELAVDHSGPHAERMRGLSHFMTTIVDMLLKAGARADEVASAMECAASTLTSERYSPVCKLPSMQDHRPKHQRPPPRFVELAKRKEIEDGEGDDPTGPVQEDEGEPVRDDPGVGPEAQED